ncbi:MAG: NusB antitermination factor [Thermoleophilia bacterium]|jgi:N utilization substance protein B|nr:NusB antitermination factor [Thermoleophilia bacterium]
MARTPDPSEAEFVRRVREPRATTTEPGRHRARRSAMMLLYRADLMKGDVEEAIAGFEGEHGFAMPHYGQVLVRGVVERSAEVDAEISKRLKEWAIERLGAVERAVLRIAMFELLAGDTPGPVAIDEAVELSKRYATPEAAKLVNGVLGSWLREHGGGDASTDQGEEE